ncbi:MAG: MarC family protein [Planctomycetota bacterium]|nr:MarC family protein [Planctomycetota bacterium]
MAFSDILAIFVALFVVIDPIGITPVFAALTRGRSREERRAIAARACLIAVGILTLFGLLGEAVLGGVGISMPAFRIAGGILLFVTALDMLFERRSKRREGQAPAEHDDDPAVFPLATPLIAGPGSITTMILLSEQAGGDWQRIAMLHVVMILLLSTAFALLLTAGALTRVLGKVGINVATRLLGVLLAALAVQIVLDGIAAV